MQSSLNSGFVAKAQAFLQHHWRRALRWREKLVLREEAFHLVLAGFVGVIGGLVNLLFYHAVHLIQPGDPVEVAGRFSDWERILVPTAGGLAAGLVLFLGFRLVGPQGSTNLLEVVVAGDGRLPFRTELVKTLSAIISIATGASIGREGGITQLSATVSSKLGQIARWPPYRLRLLVGCGAASGIAAAYNAPIAGAVFSALIVLGNFSMNLFAPLVFSSVIAAMVSRSFFGIEPWYKIPPFPSATLPQLPWFVLLGLLCGGVGALFLKLLRLGETQFRKLHWPVFVRLPLAGLAVGVIAIGFPGVCGNGYSVTNSLLHEEFLARAQPLLWLAGLFAAKLVATAVTVGAGTVGGVFTPTMFVGAGTGALFGVALHELGGSAGGVPTGAFVLVGMGAVLAATTRSPLLAMILIFELSLDYSLVPPLMLACVVSILVARPLHQESVYTEHLRVKGLALGKETSRTGAVMEQTVGDFMRAPVPPMRENTPFREIANRFLTNANNFLPVVDARQRLLGVVALQDLKEFLNAHQDLGAVIAYDVMRPPPPCLTPDQRLLEALPTVLASELRNVPVVNNPGENRLVGAVVRAEMLAVFSEAIAAKSDPAR
ncbi:MAG TPA: ClcB-like voltage-gated chloride channel protein [Candidatus Acidoferrum sp.]|nr:ClcB-like voltage-gated chloride channel protein [Candidatus Acidoferrum sp.]